MRTEALNEEVEAYLGRGRYERTEVYRGYRNGSAPRRLTLGAGTIKLAVPRVRDVPEEQEPFESRILRKYPRGSDTIDGAFLNRFVEGPATRDFEPACWIADGALGLWAAVDEQSPRSAQQRCTNHKTMNVIGKLPFQERPTWMPRIRAIWQAEDEKAARRLAASAVQDLREAGYDRAADCLEDDLDWCLTFFQFPAAPWIHLRTTNPIESIFATVRLRANAAKRFKKTRSGVCLIHRVIERLSKRWRRLQSAPLCRTVPLPSGSKKKSNVA